MRCSGPGASATDPVASALLGAGYARRVDPKTRNRIVSGVLAVMLVVIAVVAAVK